MKECLQRQRYAFQQLLQLVNPDTVSLEDGEAEQLDAVRQVPMENEQCLVWAVQDGDDTATRQPLPLWLSRPVERSVTWWAHENKKWQERIEARTKVGRCLTASAQQKYDCFQKEQSQTHLLFSKKTMKQVVKLTSHKELNRRQQELFSVQISMCADPSKLALKGGSGEARRLVLVQSEAEAAEATVPPFLAHGGVASAAVSALAEQEEEEDQDEAMGEDREEGAADAMAQEALLQEQHHMEMVEAQETNDVEEILFYSSEEETVKQCATSEFSRVKSFGHREEWRALQARGATLVPPGCFLGYHSTSRTWQGYFDGQSIGLSRTHGGRTNRSPGEALLAVLQGLVERHCQKFPRDKIWAQQLEKLNNISHTIAKL